MSRKKLLFGAVVLAGVGWYFWPSLTELAELGGRGEDRVSSDEKSRRRTALHKADRERWKEVFRNRSVPEFKIPPREIPQPAAFSSQENLTEVFERERRHPQWAPEMEATIRIRLSYENLKRVGLQDLKMADMECHTSSCRIVFEYPVDLQQRVRAEGLGEDVMPQTLLALESGPLAPKGLLERSEFFTKDGKAWRRDVSINAYDAETMDPDNHRAWAHNQMQSMRETKRVWQAQAAAR